MTDNEKLLAFVKEVAALELWDEAENGMGPTGGITRDFQEGREEEAQDLILRARKMLEERTKP